MHHHQLLKKNLNGAGPKEEKKKKKKRKRVRTIFIQQLRIQLPQLPQLLLIRTEHLVPEHVQLQHPAEDAVHELRPPRREDVLPRPLPPAARRPVRVLHQFRRRVGQAEEVEGIPTGSGVVDGGEVRPDPVPGEELDVGVAGPEVGVLGPGRRFPMRLGVRCGAVGLGDGFRLRRLSASLGTVARRTVTAILQRQFGRKAHFSR